MTDNLLCIFQRPHTDRHKHTNCGHGYKYFTDTLHYASQTLWINKRPNILLKICGTFTAVLYNLSQSCSFPFSLSLCLLCRCIMASEHSWWLAWPPQYSLLFAVSLSLMLFSSFFCCPQTPSSYGRWPQSWSPVLIEVCFFSFFLLSSITNCLLEMKHWVSLCGVAWDGFRWEMVQN